MAETNSSLGYTSKLQIVIVPKDKTYATPTDKKGKLIFREGTNIIEVNGHEYQAAKTGDLSKITEALKNTGYLTESGGVLTANNPGTVAALLGTRIATSGDDKKTVSAWIDDILGQISGINTNITNLQNATKTDGSGNFVVRDKDGSNKTDFANTTAIQKAITDAKTAAINDAKKDASDKDTQVKKDLIGGGKDSTSADSKPLKPGTGNTWAQSEAQLKNLSHLKDLILDLQGQLNTLTTSDLKGVTDAINAIEQELKDGEGTGLTTIIDGLKVFLGSGLNTGGATHTVNGVSKTTLQSIIDALESEIDAVQSKHSVVEGGTGTASTSNNYAVVSSSTTDGKTTYTVKTSTELDTAISNAKTTISTVGGTVGTTNYITVTKSTTGHDNYTIQTTSALDTVATKAADALPKGSNNTYKSAVDLANQLKGNSSSDAASATIAGAKKYADSASSTAQSNAEATALTYANNVITWTVIS